VSVVRHYQRFCLAAVGVAATFCAAAHAGIVHGQINAIDAAITRGDAHHEQTVLASHDGGFVGAQGCELLRQPRYGISWADTQASSSPTAVARDADPRVDDLPPAPSSLALVLSAAAGLGAYHGLRSVRKLHLSVTPDWYHAAAVQVGHTTPFDLEFGALPVCAFDEPAARPAFAYAIPRELGSRLRSQFFLPIEAPRGPPIS